MAAVIRYLSADNHGGADTPAAGALPLTGCSSGDVSLFHVTHQHLVFYT